MTSPIAACSMALLSVIFACGDEPSLGANSTATTTTGAGGGMMTGGHGGAMTSTAVGGMGGIGGTDSGGAGGVPLAGFGDISGSCGVLDEPQLTGAGPEYFANALDFGAMDFDYRQLSGGAKKVHDDGNLGGNSLYSEIFAYEVVHRCELADLVKTEGEIAYQNVMGKKTDLLVTIDGLSIGVSVTRAVGFPKDAPYTVEQAKLLLEDKLADIQLSSANVSAADGWEKQILLILAYADEHASALQQALAQVDAATKADTVVWVTLTDGNDAFIY